METKIIKTYIDRWFEKDEQGATVFFPVTGKAGYVVETPKQETVLRSYLSARLYFLVVALFVVLFTDIDTTYLFAGFVLVFVLNLGIEKTLIKGMQKSDMPTRPPDKYDVVYANWLRHKNVALGVMAAMLALAVYFSVTTLPYYFSAISRHPDNFTYYGLLVVVIGGYGWLLFWVWKAYKILSNKKN